LCEGPEYVKPPIVFRNLHGKILQGTPMPGVSIINQTIIFSSQANENMFICKSFVKHDPKGSVDVYRAENCTHSLQPPPPPQTWQKSERKAGTNVTETWTKKCHRHDTHPSKQAPQSSECLWLQNEQFHPVSHFNPIGIALTAFFSSVTYPKNWRCIKLCSGRSSVYCDRCGYGCGECIPLKEMILLQDISMASTTTFTLTTFKSYETSRVCRAIFPDHFCIESVWAPM
jgi:hypothetical protein